MGLQPVGPFVWHIIRDGLAPVLLFYLLDLQSHLDRLPRFEAEVDDRDLAGTARLGFLLQRLVDGGAEGVRIVNAEHSDRLVMLDELVDQVARGSRGEPLRRHDRAIVSSPYVWSLPLRSTMSVPSVSVSPRCGW